MNVSVQSICDDCNLGRPSSILARGRHRGRAAHAVYGLTEDGREYALRGEFVLCKNIDDEHRSIGEPFGFFEFAWWPRRCRNGKVRWLRSVEHHSDGTYTLGNRAH
jgi:hypothetical protein